MGQCMGCVKYLLFVFNFCLWLLGCALLSVGVWMKVDDSAGHYVQQMTDKTDDEYQISYSAIGGEDTTVTISYLLIVFGIVLIIVTFIGCCGAVRENMCMLAVFAVCLCVLMAALLGVGGWAYTKKDSLNTHTEVLRNRTDANINRAVRMYFDDQISEEFMDNVQKRFRCCGSNQARESYRYAGRVPESCEVENYNRGCNYYYFWYVAAEIHEFLDERYSVLTGVAIGVALCLGIGVFLAILLACLIRRATRLVVS